MFENNTDMAMCRTCIDDEPRVAPCCNINEACPQHSAFDATVSNDDDPDKDDEAAAAAERAAGPLPGDCQAATPKKGRPRFKKPRQADRFAKRAFSPENSMGIQTKAAKGFLILQNCENDERWNRMDTGSAPHVADHRRHFPGQR